MRRMILAFPCALTLAGCVTPPASPMDRHARLAAGAEFVAKQCSGHVGGYSSAQEMKADADRNIIAARKLGATDATIQQARKDVQNAYAGAYVLVGEQEACRQLVSELAWSTN